MDLIIMSPTSHGTSKTGRLLLKTTCSSNTQHARRAELTITLEMMMKISAASSEAE